MSRAGGFFTIMSSKSNSFINKIQSSLACIFSYNHSILFLGNIFSSGPSKVLNYKSRLLFLVPQRRQLLIRYFPGIFSELGRKTCSHRDKIWRRSWHFFERQLIIPPDNWGENQNIDVHSATTVEDKFLFLGSEEKGMVRSGSWERSLFTCLLEKPIKKISHSQPS